MRMPLRWSSDDGGRDEAEVRASGYFDSAGECARVVAASAGDVRTIEARAFASLWPVVADDRWRVAPAVPAAVGAGFAEGPDGIYSGRGEAIVREACGAERPLVVDADGTTEDEPFELLWFEAGERLLVRQGTLEVEDLFSRLTLAATDALLDRLLLRARCLSPDLVSAVGTAAAPVVAKMQVRRPLSLVGAGSVVDDPRPFLEARAEASGVATEGDRYVVKLHTGGRVVFAATPVSGGWSLRREDGQHPFSAIVLAAGSDDLQLAVDLDETIDPMSPGMRGRLAFDLQADLVALSQKV